MKSNVAMGGEQKQIGVKSDANTLYSLLDALHNHSMNVHLIPSETACSINVQCE
jgi:hypothetical protein